jgi:hypothetical protein
MSMESTSARPRNPPPPLGVAGTLRGAVRDGVGAAVRVQAGGSGGFGGALAWPALLRKLDRVDSSYRS